MVRYGWNKNQLFMSNLMARLTHPTFCPLCSSSPHPLCSSASLPLCAPALHTPHTPQPQILLAEKNVSTVNLHKKIF
jgi:hypothetical protein